MIEAKRYEAVHLRYEDNNIRYGEGCEIEVVTARKYEELLALNDDLLEAIESLILFSKPDKKNAAALHNAYRVVAKARGEE